MITTSFKGILLSGSRAGEANLMPAVVWNRRSAGPTLLVGSCAASRHCSAVPLLACVAATPAAAADRPKPAPSTATAPPVATCSTATGTTGPIPATPGSRSGCSARRASPAGADDGAARRQRGRLLQRQLHRLGALVPQGLPAPARRRGSKWVASLRVGQLPREGVAERPAARVHVGAYLPFELRGKSVPQARRQPPRRAGRQPPPDVSTSRRCPSGRPARSRAAGGTTTASCARSTCASGHVRLQSVACPPRCAVAGAPATIRVRGHGAQRHPTQGRHVAGSPVARAPLRLRFRRPPRPGPRPRSRSGRGCGSATRACGSPATRALHRVAVPDRRSGAIVQRYDRPHGDPQPQGEPARSDRAERPRGRTCAAPPSTRTRSTAARR